MDRAAAGVTAGNSDTVAIDVNEKPMSPRVDPFLSHYFQGYARDLRGQGHKVRNAFIVDAAVQEFARRELITLVKGSEAIPNWFPPGKVRLVKAKNGLPIWMPTKELLENWIDVLCAITPEFSGGSLRWSVQTESHIPALRKALGQTTRRRQ
jgi:hypothetical protein